MGEIISKPGRKQAKADTEGMWIVFCKNAVPTKDNPSGVQEHETPDRTVYRLHHKEECYMPARHAAIFLRDPAFIVLDNEGERVFPMVAQPDAGAALQPGQVIVSLAELSDQAVLNRARQVNPLAEKKLGRDALIKIIETGTTAPPAAGEGEDPGDVDHAADAELTDE